SWTAATTGNNWTNWTAYVTLTPGTNTVQAYAVDTSGNLSPTNTVRFEYVVLKPLTVQIFGLGTVNPKWGTLNPNYTNGTPLAINENYTLTANASSGFAFTNWTDGSSHLLTNRATLQFTMVTNLTLRANLVDVQKPTVSIVTPTSNQQWTNGGFTVTGKASDNVAVGTVYYSLNGSSWTAATTGAGRRRRPATTGPTGRRM
ncbi:MAG: Ig-like domain-containing protein, partial [Verrucomicrobiota bacterium]